MASSAPPVPVLFPATKLKRFRKLQDNGAYPLTTYLANEDAQLIISEAVDGSSERNDPEITYQICQSALAKFPFSVDAFLEVAYLYETYWNDLEKAKTAYERAIQCCNCLWPSLAQQHVDYSDLHEMRLLQQAYFGLASVELDIGNTEAAMAHVATLERLDPSDASGNRVMFDEKYESMMNPTSAVATTRQQEDYSDDDNDDNGDQHDQDAASSSSGTNSFFNDSGDDDDSDGNSASSIETERSMEEIVAVETRSRNKSANGNKPANTQSAVEAKRQAIPPSVSRNSKPASELPPPPPPPKTSSPGLWTVDSKSSSPRKMNRYMSKSNSGGVDKTLATSYFLSANVSLENGDIDAALEHARSLLKVDPKDECGCLWKFFERFVRANFEDEDVEQILSGGASSCECYFRYCFIILDIMKLETGEATMDKLHETVARAVITNPLVPELLLSGKELPECMTQPVPGGLSEAAWYVNTDRDTWDGVEEALHFLHHVRFQNGKKPNDDGQILRSILSQCRVLVDIKLPGMSEVQTLECTTQGDLVDKDKSASDSTIVCFGIPVLLDRGGRRLEGRTMSIPWDYVRRVHFWDLLYASKFLSDTGAVEEGYNSPVSIIGRESIVAENERPVVGTDYISSVSPIERSLSPTARADRDFKAAMAALDQNDEYLAMEHIRSLLDDYQGNDFDLLSQIFRSFVRNNYSNEVAHYILPASHDNAETLFRWRLVMHDKRKLDDGKISSSELDETIVRALERNSFVPTFLLRGERSRASSGQFVTGSVSEALWYVNIEAAIWNSAPEAMEALLLTRFRDGLKPQDDGALLMSLLERCRLTIDIITRGEPVTYECRIATYGDDVPTGAEVTADATKFVCFATPAQTQADEPPHEGHWITFKYESVEKIPFWKIMVDSKYLMSRSKDVIKPLLVRDGSISEISTGSASHAPREPMLRRALKRSSLSNSSLLSDKSVSFFDNSSSRSLSSQRMESPQGAYQAAQRELEAGNIDQAMEYIRKLLKLDPKDDFLFVAKIFRIFVERNFNDDEVDGVLNAGKNSAECFFRYSFVILDHMKRAMADCSTKGLEDTLALAIQTNPFVPELLLENNVPPVAKIRPIPGEMSEAIFYVNTDSGTWSCVRGALDWLRRSRFRNGMKPDDGGRILRDLLFHGKVIVDIKLSGDEVITYQCTNVSNGPGSPHSPKAVDSSKIVCFATPAELGFRGQPRAGKHIAFSYTSVQRIHYWHVLHRSSLLAERRLCSTQSSISFDNPQESEDTSTTDNDYDQTQSSDDPSCVREVRQKSLWFSSVSKSKRSVSTKVSIPVLSPRLAQRRSIRQGSGSRVASLRDKLFSGTGKKDDRAET